MILAFYIKLKRKKNSGGFTLLEVLLAVVIFSIVITALYSTYRIGLKAYKTGQENMDELQQVRFIFDIFSKDIRNVYYLNDSEYNQAATTNINAPTPTPTPESGSEAIAEEDIYNPYNKNISIDLAMNGEDGDEVDSISFVRYQASDEDSMISPWGLTRITWRVEEERLLRTEKPVTIPERDPEGEIIEEQPERVDVLATNVVGFNISYGYFFLDRWMESQQWNSAEHIFKNPLPTLDPEDENYDEISKMSASVPDDDLPAYVRITMTIADPLLDKKKKMDIVDIEERRPRDFSVIINFPSSQENFKPLFKKDDEMYDTVYGADSDGKLYILNQKEDGEGNPQTIERIPPVEANIPGNTDSK